MARCDATRGPCWMKTDSSLHQIESASHLNKVVFRDMASASVSARFFSLFPGLGYAAAYKVRPMACKPRARSNSDRSSNAYTSLVDSPSYGTISRKTTGAASIAHSARAMARLSCTRPPDPSSESVKSFFSHWTFSRSSGKPTPMHSGGVDWPKLSLMKDLDCTVAGDGLPPVTHRAPSRYG